MGVGGLVHGEGDGGAGVADALPAADLLGAVQVPQGHVGRVAGEDVHGQGVLVSAEHPPLRELRELAPDHVEVPHGHEGLAGLPAPAGLSQGGLVDLAHAGHQGVAPVEDAGLDAAGQVRRAEEGHGGTPGGHGPGGVVQGEHHALEVCLTALRAREGAQDLHAKGLEHGVRGLEAGGGVVVATDDHHVQGGQAPPQLGEEAVPGAHGPGGRVGRLEDVSRDEQGVHGAGLQEVQQPGEEGVVLAVAGEVVQGVAEVPVTGVQDAQHGSPEV